MKNKDERKKITRRRQKATAPKRRKSKISIREKIEISTSVVIAFMAIATAWLGWETRLFNLIDVGPTIYVSDAAIQLISASGTPVKKRSWREGEMIEVNAVGPLKLSSAVLSIRFMNTGSQSGLITLTNTKEIAGLIGSTTIGSYGEYLEVVPAKSETGWLYPFDISKANFAKTSSTTYAIVLKYNVGIYTIDLTLKENIEFSVHCQLTKKEPNLIDVFCLPVKFVEAF